MGHIRIQKFNIIKLMDHTFRTRYYAKWQSISWSDHLSGIYNILFLEDVKLHKTKVKLYVPSHVEHKNKKKSPN